MRPFCFLFALESPLILYQTHSYPDWFASPVFCLVKANSGKF